MTESSVHRCSQFRLIYFHRRLHALAFLPPRCRLKQPNTVFSSNLCAAISLSCNVSGRKCILPPAHTVSLTETPADYTGSINCD